MRKIETEIISDFVAKFDVSLSIRDSIDVDRFYGSVVYRLHGNAVAVLFNHELKLGVEGGRWQTETTKSRINAFARHFNVPSIYQKNFIWYWSDDVEYTGPRIFQL